MGRKKSTKKKAKRRAAALPTVSMCRKKVQAMKNRTNITDQEYKMLCGIEGAFRKLQRKDK